MIALASDFDGTISFSEGEDRFLPGDLEQIRRFQAQGNLFGICTGRSLHGIEVPVGNQIRFDFYILLSGALVLDGQKKTLYKKCLKRQVVKEICEQFIDRINVRIQSNDCIYALRDPDKNHVKIDSLDEIPDEDMYALACLAADPQEAGIMCSEINRLFGGEVTAFQNVEYIDVVAKGCSKGTGVRMVKEKLQPEQIMAIGDSFNDISMLESADLSFTFHRSPEEVQKKADHLVDTVEEAIDKAVHIFCLTNADGWRTIRP